MWIKLIVCVLVVAFCVLLGYLAAGKYRERKQFFTQFHAFHERYLSELGYTRRPLNEFLLSCRCSGDFGALINDFSQNRETTPKFRYLTQDERGEIKDYLDMLGKGDALSQKGYFSEQTERIKGQRNCCEEAAKRNTALFLKLGLLAGLAFVILII